ncbi:MAG: NAD(P)H-binding protein [Gammaproteobacteria bacterium]|nr:NAD(P)H-binding protein [Gammaproteobacteria bacterium]
MRIAVTGANSSVGLRLLAHAADAGIAVNAGVRSESALRSLPSHDLISPRIISYREPDSLDALLDDCGSVVHLAGILIPGKHTNYREANVDATASVADAARRCGLQSLVFISVLGASPGSANPYFRSKGEAEKIAAGSAPAGVVIRTPILLGPGSAGSAALLASVKRGKASLLGGGKYVLQPLDVDDLCAAIIAACRRPEAGTYELAGPERIAYRDLVRQTAELLGRPIRLRSVPVWLARLGAAAGSRLRGGGITPAVIDVITADEEVKTNADDALGIELTPLRETLLKLRAKLQETRPS